MGAGQAAVDEYQRAFERASSSWLRVKALRRAVRVDNFRLAQRLRMGLALYLRHLKEPLRNDVERLVRVSGLWVRNVDDRHRTKQNIQRIIRQIIPRLNTPHTQSAGSG